MGMVQHTAEIQIDRPRIGIGQHGIKVKILKTTKVLHPVHLAPSGNRRITRRGRMANARLGRGRRRLLHLLEQLAQRRANRNKQVPLVHQRSTPVKNADGLAHKIEDAGLVHPYGAGVLCHDLEQEDDGKGNHHVEAQREAVEQQLHLLVGVQGAQDGGGADDGRVGHLVQLRRQGGRRRLGLGPGLRVQAPEGVGAEVQLGKVEVKADALGGIVADLFVGTEALAPVGVPRVEGDGEAPQLRHLGRRDGLGGLGAEAVEYGAVDGPYLDLGDEADVVLDGVLRLEQRRGRVDADALVGHGRAAVQDRRVVVAHVDVVVEPRLEVCVAVALEGLVYRVVELDLGRDPHGCITTRRQLVERPRHTAHGETWSLPDPDDAHDRLLSQKPPMQRPRTSSVLCCRDSDSVVKSILSSARHAS